MKRGIIALTLSSMFILSAFPAQAAYTLNWKELTLNAQINASLQSALFYEPNNTADHQSRSNYDASLLLNAEWLNPQGWLLGARFELDSGDRTNEALQRDEAYLYFVDHYGRIEIGKQDGPADRLSYHAPILGLGQIRGDFARYTGDLALLSPLDSGDSAKIIFLSAPSKGLRYGLSYAPRYHKENGSPNPAARTLQNNAVEMSIRYKQPLKDYIWGISASYVNAQSDPITQRADINSWSIGSQLRRKRLTIGAAYVQRGDSNQLIDFDQWEINAGISWQNKTWGVALSSSNTLSNTSRHRLIGFGGFKKLRSNLTFRSDLVITEERNSQFGRRHGYAFISELDVKI